MTFSRRPSMGYQTAKNFVRLCIHSMIMTRIILLLFCILLLFLIIIFFSIFSTSCAKANQMRLIRYSILMKILINNNLLCNLLQIYRIKYCARNLLCKYIMIYIYVIVKFILVGNILQYFHIIRLI